MATKSQLKQYFETGKIPTQAQFGDLIDSIFNIIGSPDGSLNINGDENNIKLSIKNYRSLHGIYMSQLSVSLHLFFNNDIKNGTKNNMTVRSEWEKIMELQGYEDGLVIDNSGVAENFMNTIHANCYKQIQIK